MSECASQSDAALLPSSTRNRNSIFHPLPPIKMTEKDAGSTVSARELSSSSTNTSNGNKNDSASNKQSSANSNNNKSVHLVFQRFRHCRLLLNEDTVIHVGKSTLSLSDNEDGIDNLLLNPLSTANNPSDTAADTASPDSIEVVVGLLVYVSFSSSATKVSVYNAAKTVLNLPIITLGSWGDGTTTKSILQIAASTSTAKRNSSTTDETSSSPSYHNVNLVIVPQANLISKVKANGKSIQYHGQCQKDVGNDLYEYFIDSLQNIATEQQATCRNEMEKYNKDMTKKGGKNESDAVDIASISPKEYFRFIDKESKKYGSFDNDTGVPTTNSTGEPLTKSAIKKIRKLHETQCKRYEKYLEKQKKQEEYNKQHPNQQEQSKGDEFASPTTNENNKNDDPNEGCSNHNDHSSCYKLDPNFLHIVAGTFGKRQGLTMTSDMGPFCHVVQI